MLKGSRVTHSLPPHLITLHSEHAIHTLYTEYTRTLKTYCSFLVALVTALIHSCLIAPRRKGETMTLASLSGAILNSSKIFAESSSDNYLELVSCSGLKEITTISANEYCNNLVTARKPMTNCTHDEHHKRPPGYIYIKDVGCHTFTTIPYVEVTASSTYVARGRVLPTLSWSPTYKTMVLPSALNTSRTRLTSKRL